MHAAVVWTLRLLLSVPQEREAGTLVAPAQRLRLLLRAWIFILCREPAHAFWPTHARSQL